MSGYGGESKRRVGKDFVEHPDLVATFGRRFVHRAKISNAPQAIADVKYTDTGPIKDEIARFKKYASNAFAEQFMTAPSPGIVATTLMNAHYDSHEAYVNALAVQLRKEYLAIHEAGLILQVDAPDLAMERVMMFQDETDEGFVKIAEMHLAAINKACEGIPARPLAAAHLLGQLGRPARLRHRARQGAAGVLPDDRRRALDRVRQSAPSARIRGVQGASVPEGQDPDPRRDRVRPRISSSTRKWSRGASRRRSRRSATASASSRRPTAASAPSRAANGSRRASCGRSSRPCARAPTLRRAAVGEEGGVARLCPGRTAARSGAVQSRGRIERQTVVVAVPVLRRIISLRSCCAAPGTRI